MMLAPTTNHRIPMVPMPYVEEVARKVAFRAQRRPLMLDMFISNRWLFHQDYLARLAAVKKAQPVAQPSQPGCNFTYSAVAFHGWRKLAWYAIGLLDNIAHVWRIAA